MAAAFGLPAHDLLRAALIGPHAVQVTGAAGSGRELFLNAVAQTALAQFTGTPIARLAASLPSLTAGHERIADDAICRVSWYTPREAWVTACLACTGAAWLPGQPVLVYPGAAGHVCRRHRRWLLAHTGKPASIPLRTLPEILAAHRHHVVLVRAHKQAGHALALAAAVVWSWQVQGWRSERVWQDRVRRLAVVTGCTPAAVAPHALLTYPETVTIARLLTDRCRQRRLQETIAASGIRATTTMLLEEIGHRIGRPWLVDWLNSRARVTGADAARSDPLRQWLETLATATPAHDGTLDAVFPPAVRPASSYGEQGGVPAGDRRAALEEAKAAALTGGWQPDTAAHPVR